jgi:outer membrane protein assembly factor BamB
VIRIFIFFFTSLILTNCSLNENSKIWNKKKKIEVDANIKIIFDEKQIIYNELNENINLNLSKIDIKNKILDDKNNFGVQNYSGKLKKIKNYKFSKFKYENEKDLTPLFLKDGIIFFDSKGSIIRFSNNQKIIWKKNYYSKFEKKNNPKLSFALLDKKLVVVDNLSNVFLINLENGNLIWKKRNNYPFNSEIKINDDRFFVIDLNNVLRCYFIRDGSECWNYETEKTLTITNSKNSLLISENTVYFINNLGDLTAIDLSSGALVWQLPTQSSEIKNITYNFENSKLVSEGKNIFFSNNKNEFYSIDLKNGSINWINNISSSLTPILIKNFIITISDNGYLFAIDKEKGNIIKIKDIYKIYSNNQRKKIKPTGFSISQDKIYLSNNDGKLIIIELKTGNVLKVEKIARNILSKPFLYNNYLFMIKNGAVVQYE